MYTAENLVLKGKSLNRNVTHIITADFLGVDSASNINEYQEYFLGA